MEDLLKYRLNSLIILLWEFLPSKLFNMHADSNINGNSAIKLSMEYQLTELVYSTHGHFKTNVDSA